MPRLPRRVPTHASGVTLVELMVAISLGAILIGVVTFVWIQSNKIFTTTINKLEIYQRLRTVLDIMERDLANTNRTVDMEFYVDGDPDGPGPANPLRPNGHYDEAKDIVGPATASLPNGDPDFRTPRDPQDLLFGKDEFGDDGGSFANFPMLKGQSNPFLYAGAVLSPQPYMINAGYTDNRAYWRDEVYVRTYAMVDGLNKPSLVHYRLVQLADGRSALRRRLWTLNENNQLVFPGTLTRPATDRTSILSHGIADLKVAFYFKETTSQEVGGTSGVGHWYHLGNADEDWSNEGKALRDADEQRGMLSARGVKALSAQHQNQFQNGDNAVSFVFEGAARIEYQDVGGAVLRGLEPLGPGESLLDRPISDVETAGRTYDKTATFPGVRPGDRFFVYGATDDDSSQSPGITGPLAKELFPDQILTVSLIYTDNTEEWAAVKFSEPISFFSLGTTWLGYATNGEPPTLVGDPVAGTPSVLAGPARNIVQSFNVNYRVGFLPAAFLIRLSCDDPYNRNILQMERVIRLLEQ